jgi:hypothetical protein
MNAVNIKNDHQVVYNMLRGKHLKVVSYAQNFFIKLLNDKRKHGSKNNKIAIDFILDLFDDYILDMEATPSFIFFAKNRKSAFKLMFPAKLVDAPTYFFKQGTFTLALESIHSFQAGEGTKIMKRLVEFSDKYDCALMLFCESKKTIKFYEKFGFENKGKLGKGGEFFMIYKKNKETGYK